MTAPAEAERVAILWQLRWVDGSLLVCSVYRDGNRLLLCIESNSVLVVSEHFDLQPRAVSKAQALRQSLKRRGWLDAPLDGAASPDQPPID